MAIFKGFFNFWFFLGYHSDNSLIFFLHPQPAGENEFCHRGLRDLPRTFPQASRDVEPAWHGGRRETCAARPSPQLVSSFIIFVLFIYLFSSRLPPAREAVFGAGHQRPRRGGKGAPPRDRLRDNAAAAFHLILLLLSFCLAARPLPRNRRGSNLSYFIFIIVVMFRFIIYLFTLYLPPAFSAVFRGGAHALALGGGARPRDRRCSVPSYFIVVFIFIR